MSTALINAAHLKPEVRLGQAIIAFEKELTKVQRDALYIHKAESSTNPPDHGDVMRLPSEVDETSKVVAGRRCFSPRFTGIFNAVRHFALLEI
jgi:hypothetical protein